MRLGQVGKDASAVEIVNISPFGVWIYVDGREHFMDYDRYPWFREAKVGEIINVRRVNVDHLYWPELDVDLSIDALETPSSHPLVDKSHPRKVRKARLSDEAFIGMWRDREDMKDSSAWVRALRSREWTESRG